MTTVRRNLLDLYETGRELRFEHAIPKLDDAGEPVLDDETGQPVIEATHYETVWVSKLNKLDHRRALRAADAAKAQVLIGARNRTGDEWKSAIAVVHEMMGDNPELLVEYLVSEQLAQRQEAIGAEVEGEEVDGEDGPEPSEWAKDNYLQGLHDLWDGTGPDDELSMRHRYAMDDTDLEANRVLDEIKRFMALVDERLEEERAALTAELAQHDVDTLIDKVADSHVEAAANSAWFEEYNAARIWLGLRKATKHSEYYLQSRADVDRLEPHVAQQILATIEMITVDSREGKGLPATRTSSL